MIDIRCPAESEADRRGLALARTRHRQKGELRSQNRLLPGGGIRKPQNEDGAMSNMSERDQLMSLLFEGDNHLDLKFFRSPTPKEGGVTAEDICREIRSAIAQKEAGTATVTKSFGDDAPKIDVRTLFRT